MPITSLDANTALVVIDMQKGLAALPTVHPFQDVLASTLRLIKAFRHVRLPVALVTVAPSPSGDDWPRNRSEIRHPAPSGSEFGQLVSEIDAQPDDIRITKRQWNAFYGTELDLQLRRRHVTGVVLAGVTTSIGVDSTARAAHERAYNVAIATDAVTDLDHTAHEFAMTRIFPLLAEMSATDALVKMLQER
jgi:nicotinamidase-related amidase